MQVNEFEIGKTYAITTKDWAAPDGSGTVPGKFPLFLRRHRHRGGPGWPPCPKCGREVLAAERGELAVTTEVRRYATLPDGRKAVLSLSQT